MSRRSSSSRSSSGSSSGSSSSSSSRRSAAKLRPGETPSAGEAPPSVSAAAPLPPAENAPRGPRPPADDVSIHVSMIPGAASEEDLRQYFASAGPIVEVVLRRGPSPDHPSYAFVKFESPESRVKALALTEPLLGDTIKIEPRTSLDRARRDRPFRDRFPPRRDGPSRFDRPRDENRRDGSCFACGRAGHSLRECPNGGADGVRTCFRCGKLGHIGVDCPEFGGHRDRRPRDDDRRPPARFDDRRYDDRRYDDRRYDDRRYDDRRYDDRRYDDRRPPARFDDRRYDDRRPPARFDDRRYDDRALRDRSPPRRPRSTSRERPPRVHRRESSRDRV